MFCLSCFQGNDDYIHAPLLTGSIRNFRLILRLADSLWLYRTQGKQEQAAILKRQDAITFTNVMWVVTLSCFPQAIFQTSEALKLLFVNSVFTGRKLFLESRTYLLTTVARGHRSIVPLSPSPNMAEISRHQ